MKAQTILCRAAVLPCLLLMAVVLSPAAHAGPSDRFTQPVLAIERPPSTGNVSTAALPTCTAFTDNGSPTTIRIPSVGWHTWAIDCKLQQDNYDNWGVVALQQSLRYCNNAPQVEVDGDYGPITRDVIAWIQGANGLRVDGVYGPETRRVMWFAHIRNNQWTGACGRL